MTDDSTVPKIRPNKVFPPIQIIRTIETGADNCSARRDGKQNLYDEIVDGIHKRNARNGGLSHRCDHQHVHHAHEYREKLFDDQRPQELIDLFAGEQ